MAAQTIGVLLSSESLEESTENGDIEDCTAPMISNEDNHTESHDHHNRQKNRSSLKNAEPRAKTLLVTIAIKSFTESIAFVLTIQDSLAAGIAFLIAMIFKLLALEPGFAIILLDAGMTHNDEQKYSTMAAALPFTVGRFFVCSNFRFRNQKAIPLEYAFS